MAFQLSPGVNVSEIDLTTIVPAVGTTEGAFAGVFNWGPFNEIISVGNELELVDRFGRPDSTNFESWFTCANFLSYARNLRVVRAGNTQNSKTATAGSETILIKNRDDYELNYLDLSAANTVGMFAARYPGDLGNSLKVSTYASSNSAQFSSWAYYEEFTTAPGTSTYTANLNGANDEMHIIVLDEDGKFSGVANTVLEKFSYVSKAFDAKNDDGSSNYYVNVINERSKYIYIMNHALGSSANVQSITFTTSANGYSNGNITFSGGIGSGAAGYINVNATNFIVSATITNKGSGYNVTDTVTGSISSLYVGGANSVGTPANTATAVLQLEPETANWGLTAANTSFSQNTASYTSSLAGGVSATVTDANIVTAYDKFANPDEVDISLIMAGSHSATVAQHIIDNIALVRKDCVAFISPRRTDVVNNAGEEVADITAFRNNILARSSSYAVLDSGWKYQFDKYNNLYRWVPLNGDIAGLCVRTDFERDPWFSPAGFNRGQIKNVVKLAWNPTKANRDDLYKIGINPVVQFPGEGTVLFGDKTLQSKPSAFDRINVRRLFIVLEKAIARASKYSLFEFNDEFTRAQFVALVEPFLRDVQGRRGIYDYRVVCDETNNTPEVIDRNEFIGDIYIKPARSINFIQLNFIAVRTGVAFDEIVGKF